MRQKPHKTPRRNRHARPLRAALLAALCGRGAQANPLGLTVQQGSATVAAEGSRLSIQTSQAAVLNWQSFNIAPGERTVFQQPSSSSVALNVIRDQNPSQILGGVEANGMVVLVNQAGFYFGPNSFVKAASFIASTANPAPFDFSPGGGWSFTGPPPQAKIVNYGRIEVGEKGSAFLIAHQVENRGSINAPGGSAGLLAGQEVLLSERPDGRGLSAAVRLPTGAVANTGRIAADAGRIALTAQVVNQNGILQADSVRERGGVIELVASEDLQLGPESRLLARGDTSPSSPGGNVLVKSDNRFGDSPGGEIIVTGGTSGGDGGQVEVSALSIASLDSRMDAAAGDGARAGRLLLDPTDITLGTSGKGGAGNGKIGAGDSPATLQLNVGTAFLNKNFSEITLQATRNITLAQGTTWDLSASTGLTVGQLTLQAGNDILFGTGARLVDANNWSVRLEAGVDFAARAVKAGPGSILLNGGVGGKLDGSVATGHGAIEMAAGDSILVGAGSIRTTAGGGIHLHAFGGDIDAGKKNDGYEFSINGYKVGLGGLGGIGTAAGGDVTLEAGRDIVSIPTVPANQPVGASGAYGGQPGDVTLVAGRQIFGNFLVRNGTGSALAGVTVQDGKVSRVLNSEADVGSALRPVSLSLVSGSWNVWAARDVFLSEVRNPNGTFNRNRLSVPAGVFSPNLDTDDSKLVAPPARVAFLFDYAPDAAANIWAGRAIGLIGENLPRVTGQNQNMPAIYPPKLSLDAGSGGIEIRNSLILYPSSQGSLRITTRAGGDLSGRQQQSSLAGITMSDSALPDFRTFAGGHAATPLHLRDAEPVRLKIDGGIGNFGLTVPTQARIEVRGDTYNFGFLGQNLSPAAVTEIGIAGDIRYRGNLTSVPLAEDLPPEVFNPALSANPQVTLKLRRDAGAVMFIGQMTDDELQYLLAPQALLFQSPGVPLRDENGVQLTAPIPLTPAQQASLQKLHDESQSASLADQGLALAGPGILKVSARNADLGISGGITVLAPNRALAAITPLGAQMELSFSGNLDMTSTKIENESYLGGISLRVGGALDVGGQFTTFGDAAAPKGIFTASGGNLSVLADRGDVNVNGSRIAAYNGGNVTVRSEHGNVNAGSGAAGYVSFRSLEIDSATGGLRSSPATIPGSGILATTLPDSAAPVLGNILVEAPEGSVNASLGGIIQLAFNDADTAKNFVELRAGRSINAGGSGIIGSNIRLFAGGDITGVIIGSQRVDITSQQSVDVAAFAGGGASISAGGTVGGSVSSGGSVSVSADSISTSVASKNVSSSGDSAAAASPGAPSNATKPEGKAAEEAGSPKGLDKAFEEETNQKKKPIQLSQKVGRVTVILPAKP